MPSTNIVFNLKKVLFILSIVTFSLKAQDQALEKEFCHWLLNNKQYDQTALKYYKDKKINLYCDCQVKATYNAKEDNYINALFIDVMPILKEATDGQTINYFFKPVEIAIRTKNTELLTFFINEEHALSNIGIQGQRPLQIEINSLKKEAYYTKHGLKMVDFLIEQGDDPLTISINGIVNKKLIRDLTARGFDINTIKMHNYLRDKDELQWLFDQGYNLSESKLDQIDGEWIVADSARIAKFVDRGLKIDTNKLLHIARKQENWKIVNQLLDLGANPNVRDEYGKTMIYYAVLKSDLNLIKKLIRNGADYQPKKLKFEYSILTSAVEVNKANIVKYLLSRNVNPNYSHENAEHNPLVKAYSIGNDTIIQMLIDHGANFDKLIGGQYDYSYFTRRDPGYKLLRQWMARGLKLDMMVCGDGTFLHRAIREGNQELIDLLVDHIKQIEVLGVDHDSPLTCAAKYNRTDVCLRLIEKGANINHYDSTYYHTTLNYAINHDNITLIKVLLVKELVIESENKYKHPIYKLISRKKTAILKEFIKHDYLPTEEMMPNFMDLQDKELVLDLLNSDYIPNFYTAKRIVDFQDTILINKMIDNGLDLNSFEEGNEEYTLKKYAKKKGFSKQVQLLLKHE